MIQETDTIHDIVTRHPELKEVLVRISPKFANLNNPVLFNTVAKVTTVKKAASMGKIYLNEMLYELNSAIGLGKEFLEQKKSELGKSREKFMKAGSEEKKEKPAWYDSIRDFPVHDFRNSGEPFFDIQEIAKKNGPGKGFIILQKFLPTPVMAWLETQGFENYPELEAGGVYRIAFYKPKE